MSDHTNPTFFEQMPLPRVVTSPRWVRVKFGGEFIADSLHPKLFIKYSMDMLPTYFFDKASVRSDILHSPEEKGDRRYWTVKVGDKEARRAAWGYINPPDDLHDLCDHITFKWDAMDAWYEEAEEIFVHARDPYSRVDVMASTRHIQVVVNGEIIADTKRPSLLFETYLPTRYYIPAADIQMDYLIPSPTTSQCPYKGKASYWSINVGDVLLKDVVWSYQNPILENPKIRGLYAFFNEKLDAYIDGVLQERPLTPWA